MNWRQYGKFSQSPPKIPSGNLQQSLNLAPPPSATLTFPPLLTTPSPLFPTPPTPTPILTPQTTAAPTTTSISIHVHHIPQTTMPEKDKKPCLHHIHSLHHNFNDHVYQHLRTYHLAQETLFQKDKTIRPDHHPKEKPTHTQSSHFHRFQAKATQKISPLIETPQNQLHTEPASQHASQHTPPPVPLPLPPPP